MRLFRRRDFIPVLRFSGPIGMATPLRPGLALATLAGPLEKAFKMSKLPAVAIAINSPGGSPVQSNLIFNRIRQLAAETNKRVHVFCEDVAASGGYYIAVAGDEIYADPSSIVGSIGVISQGFGFEKAIEKLGIERRVYTSGTNKGSLDPFLAEKLDDVVRLKALQADVQLARLQPDDPCILYNLACSHCLVKNFDEAVTALSRSITKGFHDFKWLLKDPDLASLRKDPIFKTVWAKISSLATGAS